MTALKLADPIFLMCSERSGSNLITKLFDAHPQVAAPGPSHLFRLFAEFGWTYHKQGSDLRRDLLAMFAAKVGSWLIDDFPQDKREKLLEGASGAAEMVAALVNAEREAAGKAFFFVKENSIFSFIPFLESVSVRPRYVWMVRDPRNMAASWQKAAVLRGGIVRASRRWLQDQEGFLKALSWLDGTRPIARLTYEELIADPDATLRRVCHDLNLPYSADMLEFDTRSRSAQADAQRASAWSNLSRPVLQEDSRKFLTELSDDQLAFVEYLCGPLMETLGYAKARDATRSPFGSCDSFEEVSALLSRIEPWDKAEYMNLPAEERARFENWSTVYDRLKQRARRLLPDRSDANV